MTPAVQTTGQGHTAAGCHQLVHQLLHQLVHAGYAFVLIICFMIKKAVP